MDPLTHARVLAGIANAGADPAYRVEHAVVPPMTAEEMAQLNGALADHNLACLDLQSHYLLLVLNALPVTPGEPQPAADHVDEFIDFDYGRNCYARFFLLLKRLSAALQCDFAPMIREYTLFCRYQDRWMRCTGASGMGDVWLTGDFGRSSGYDLRVGVHECSDWRRTPPNVPLSKVSLRLHVLDAALDMYMQDVDTPAAHIQEALLLRAMLRGEWTHDNKE